MPASHTALFRQTLLDRSEARVQSRVCRQQRGDLFLLLDDLLFLSLEPFLLLGDLRLLFFDGVDKNYAELVVLDALDLAFSIVRHQQRIDGSDFFGDQAEIGFPAFFPIKGHGPQPTDQVQAAAERPNIFLVAPTGRT